MSLPSKCMLYSARTPGPVALKILKSPSGPQIALSYHVTFHTHDSRLHGRGRTIRSYHKRVWTCIRKHTILAGDQAGSCSSCYRALLFHSQRLIYLVSRSSKRQQRRQPSDTCYILNNIAICCSQPQPSLSGTRARYDIPGYHSSLNIWTIIKS